MQIQLLLSGIGGQGVQLVGKTLAVAALAEGKNAQLYGEYGGEMRGGNSVMNAIVCEGPLNALPIVSAATHAIILNLKYWSEVENRIPPTALIFTDEALAPSLSAAGRVIAIPAREIAVEAGNVMSMGLALLGAFSAYSGAASADALVAAMVQQVPAYRAQHRATNERAIRMGTDAILTLQEQGEHA